ncbi:zinc finger and BTB domain-containing protein 38 [Clarias gariepinus]|uniref:zinc finger and BTB domain-containing protein 38 n=1 Tax=Clarias gariepinus TaxID=13013 RepID=UPI00234D593D|nr:zinc finger and BTB domain-containing protein 38 [Clarias gariepinus]XP_053357177.1 zinc finger and BTB domain-containing protein 38 [Clarias gariepinus]XP_053357178.1 zinc finger and BTB domain-containing protein 38 [Clarias gariepinus]XP_053357179.1 zinc finger and BTB domain-containing protein 38 [Clarias gariepinus]XP_053357180.1 zinc finger and BTB domain-containing protein 38 [Clarias gariepinus]XP_053357182.1 zinc finger and BTB domain-containing protein 38 [Clarias gariepinus]XP_05
MMVVHSSCNGMMDNMHSQTVLSRLSEQRSLGLFCDVTIVVEDIKFRAHRNVLAATSGYFHSVLTASETCSSSQVLEIPDLKSDVFASILNFIYSSKLDLASKGDNKSLIAAGKKLGIPFLEKLLEIERQDSGMAQSPAFAKSDSLSNQTKLSVCSTLKKETPRLEEQECSKGPRITNAFSITEVPAVNNPFTSLDSRSNGPQSPDMDHQPLSEIPLVESDSVDAMFEHSYAVNQGHQTSELKEKVQQYDKEVTKPVVLPCTTLSNHGLGPIKKRHRLCKGLAPISNETIELIQSPVSGSVQNSPLESTSLLQASSSNSALSSSPDLLPPQILPPQEDEDPPSLVPEDVPTSTTYHCQQCPEAFSSSALLAVHMQSHKRRFVSHLFCKYCSKKFMHLKRLRNHEQVCMKGLPQLELNGKEASVSLDSSSEPTPNDESFPGSDLEDTSKLDSTISGPLEANQVSKSSNQRAYKCSVCKRAYVTLSSLKRHENVHSWQRAYPCHYCNKVFALAEYRTKHEIWHTGERRYQCIFCLETFLTYYILKNHQKSFHGIDPRLAVNKKSANGGFKGSVYPIKLYRLLPMKFKKKRYKTYSQTYSEIMGNYENSFTAPLDANSQDSPLQGTDSIHNPESVTSGQSLFSMPVTFMATPKMVASEMPHITFDQPCDQNVETPLPSDKDLSRREKEGLNSTNTQSGLTGFQATVPPVFGCGYTPSLSTEENTRSSMIMHRNDSAPMRCTSNTSRDVLPFLNIPPVCSFEGLSKLSELSAAAQTIEVMANQLLQPQPETLTQNLRPDGKTETYIAKPACPGPSVNNQVLPLCQITVKIGNEAIIRRKIKGSKLFPKRKKRRNWKQDHEKVISAEDGTGFPNLRLRTEVSSSITEDEPYDDVNDPENDKLWRPYYTYKPKKKGKRFRSKRKRLKAAQYYTKPLSPEQEDNFLDMDRGVEESVTSDRSESRMELRSQSPKESFTCRCCSSSFLTSASLSKHIINCHQPRCKICGKQCPLEELPNTDVPFTEDFSCQSCTEDGSCFNSTVMTRTLSSEKRYRCSYCPQRFLYLATKKSHEAKHLERFTMEHNCRYCPKVCKSAMLLSIHENKHFSKVKETEISDKKMIASSYLSASESKEQPKIEPWAIPQICLPLSPKTDEALDMDGKAMYPKIQKTSSHLLSCKGDRTLPSFHSEIHRRKSKKKSFVEFSKNTTLGFETPVQKAHLPKSLTNNHLNTSSLYTKCLTRMPSIKGASLQSPKSEWHLCKEEPVFYSHN